MGVGAGLAVFVMRRGRQEASRFVPGEVLAQTEKSAQQLWRGAQQFVSEVKAGAAQREAQLRQAFTQDQASK